ncbi:MAG: hypothetical protein IJP72_01115 [Bacteroidales bacterium]|nr:hypothetical protein [Bacteroidales bacterium]
MRKIFTAITILMLTLSVSFAQTRQDAAPYDFSVGVNAGFFNGFTFKFFPTNNLGVQLDLGYHFLWDYQYHYIPTILSFNPNLMYEASAGNGFYWFVGGGLNIGGSLPKYSYYSETHDRYIGHHANFVFGVNAIGGVEYKFAKIPLALQVDARPGFFLFANNRWHDPYILFDYNFINLTARYTF